MSINRECPQNVEKLNIQDLIYTICTKSKVKSMFSLVGSTGRVEEKLANNGCFVISAENIKQEYDKQLKKFKKNENMSLNFGNAEKIIRNINYFKLDAAWLDFSGSLLTINNLTCIKLLKEKVKSGGHIFVTSSHASRGGFSESQLFQVIEVLKTKFSKTIITEYYNGKNGNTKYYLIMLKNE